MYYKVVNKDSEVYKSLLSQRERERTADARNKSKIEELLGFKWSSFYGRMGYQNLFRTTTYSAFNPEEGAVITKAVRPCKEYEGAYKPNARTKSGKELQNFLQYGMETFNFNKILKILGIKDDRIGKFTIPFMEEVGGVILLYLDERDEPADKNVIEVTKEEFDALLKG